MKVVCSIYAQGKVYEAMSKNAITSFKHFHDDINCRLSVGASDMPIDAGLSKLLSAQRVMKDQEADRVIILGADVIVCGRMTEMIESEAEIVGTLDYPYEPFKQIPRGEHCNADVMALSGG